MVLQVESLRKELRADRWNFVQLPWSVLKQELQGVTEVGFSTPSVCFQRQ